MRYYIYAIVADAMLSCGDDVRWWCASWFSAGAVRAGYTFPISNRGLRLLILSPDWEIDWNPASKQDVGEKASNRVLHDSYGPECLKKTP